MTVLYILESLSVIGKFYVGVTNREPERLVEHNRGQTRSTKKYTPWEVIYTESFATKAEAMKRERHLKSIHGYQERREIIEKYRRKR